MRKLFLTGLAFVGSILSYNTFAYDISKMTMIGQVCSPENQVHDYRSKSKDVSRCFKRGFDFVIASNTKADSYKIRLVNNSCNAGDYYGAFKTKCYILGTFLLQYPQVSPEEIISEICEEGLDSDAGECYKAAFKTSKNGWKPKKKIIKKTALINEWSSIGPTRSLFEYCDESKYKQAAKKSLENLLTFCREEGIECSPEKVQYAVVPSFKDIRILVDVPRFDSCNMEASIILDENH